MGSRGLQLNCLRLDRLAASAQREAWGPSKAASMERTKKMKKKDGEDELPRARPFQLKISWAGRDGN